MNDFTEKFDSLRADTKKFQRYTFRWILILFVCYALMAITYIIYPQNTVLFLASASCYTLALIPCIIYLRKRNQSHRAMIKLANDEVQGIIADYRRTLTGEK